MGIGSGVGGSPKGLVHNLLMQFFTLCSSKIEVSETHFFDILASQNDHPSYVKHVLGSIFVFFTLNSSKMEVSGTPFLDIMATHNYHPSHVKHVLGSNYVFVTLFGYLEWGGVAHQTTYQNRMKEDPNVLASDLGVQCSGWILCEVAWPKAIEFFKIRLFPKPFCRPWDGFGFIW